MLRIGIVLVAAVLLSAQTPIPRPDSSQPSPQNADIQNAPNEKKPPTIGNQEAAGNAMAGITPAANGANMHGNNPNGQHPKANTKPPRDIWDYANIVIPSAIGGLTLLVLFLQYLTLNRTDTTALIAAKAARDSADATIAQLRADVTIKSVALDHVGDGQIPVATIVFKNNGLLGARHYTQRGVMGIDLWPTPQQMPVMADPIFVEGTTVAGGGEMQLHLSLTRALQAHHIPALQNNEMAIYVVADVSFIDAFDKKSTTKFVLFSNGQAGLQHGQMAAYSEIFQIQAE